ncbi:MAG: MAPEG family protein [Hyphomicrobium sp.]
MKPVFVQAGLTFFLLFWMAKERLQALYAGKIARGDPGVRPIWPGRAGVVSNAFHNSLEMPMLFFAVVLFAISFKAVDDVMVALAWTYVACRLVHVAIHTTYNKISHRFLVYAASNLMLLAMWVKLALHLLAAG